ncbi:MAG: CDP-diacylglycerol--glycerol-3-phosphate 3-phosphatidyltransferase, partial [Caulobacteraceae bacterium]|nr:CDP-diacylglycerol--glycerol-3-phosphate 3-phosphatidyltransferase [Caulobacteraceae bacterium]
MKAIPNLITLARLILTLAVFGALSVAASGLCEALDLFWFAFWGFTLAAITDFLDGWLARRWQAESLAGAILDPIADKVLVAGA